MMSKLKFLKIGSSLLMLLFFAACSQDETLRQDALLPEGKYPLVLTAGGLDVVATPDKVNTRATSDNNWSGDEKVALQVSDDDNVYSYFTTEEIKVELTSDNPYYWKSTNDISVKAWVCGDNVFREKLTEWEVQSNQNDAASGGNYQKSDLIYAPLKTISFHGGKTLTFYHQTAQITVHVYNKEIATGKNAITMTVGTTDNPIILGGNIQEPSAGSNYVIWDKNTNKDGLVTAKNIGPQVFISTEKPETSVTSFNAMVIPQTIDGGKKLFQFTVPGLENIPFYYTTPQNGVTWEAGKSYIYLITIKGTSDEVTVNSITHGKWGDGGTYNLTTN